MVTRISRVYNDQGQDREIMEINSEDYIFGSDMKLYKLGKEGVKENRDYKNIALGSDGKTIWTASNNRYEPDYSLNKETAKRLKSILRLESSRLGSEEAKFKLEALASGAI